MRWLKIVGIILFVFVLLYAAGPGPLKPVYDKTLIGLPTNAEAIQQYVDAREKSHKLKPGNNASSIVIGIF